MDDSRRKFCQATGVALVGSMVPLQIGCGGTMQMGESPIVNTGLTAAMVMVSDAEIVQVPDHNIYVCHDGMGFYAMSANCTHARCIIQFTNPNDGEDPPDPLGFRCNCHNSQFDFNGNVVSPPAPSPLPHFKMTVDGSGMFVVDTSKVVDASTRLPG